MREGKEYLVETYPYQKIKSEARGLVTGARLRGEVEYGQIPAGQIVGMIDNIISAKEVFNEMVTEAVSVLKACREISMCRSKQ